LRAIIPAAGVGERLRPLTLTQPKVLLPVAGKPIIGHIYDRLQQAGITDVTVIINYLGALVSDYSRQNYALNFSFVDQPERRGLGHAVGFGLSELDEKVLIILGDVILDLDFAALVRSADNLIGVMPVADPRRYGVVELGDGHIRRLVEKPIDPPSNLAIAGVYLIQHGNRLKSAIENIIERNITTKQEYQLTDALQVLLERGEPFRPLDITHCYDCGTRETLLETNRLLLEKYPPPLQVEPSNRVMAPVFIHPTAKLTNTVIGPYVSVGAHTTIIDSQLEDSIIGEDNLITASVLKSSLMGSHNRICQVTGSITIGDNYHQELS